MEKSKIQIICISALVILFITLVIFFALDKSNETEIEYKEYENKYDKKIEVISEKKSDGTYSLDINNNKWKYDKDNDIYYQIGIVYCANPESVDYQCLAIYVPGKYFNGTPGQDDMYTCTINKDAQINGYTANTAPIIIPVNTAGYSAQKSTTFYEYDGLKEYMDAGLIYVYAGCRGLSDNNKISNSSAPFGVTDLKSVIRYLKYNAADIPGNSEKIFALGLGEGGSQVAIVGVSGDSSLYIPYLTQIGAALIDKQGRAISDEICGVMCWSPTLISDMSNAAYEWNYGQYLSTNTREKGTFTKALSDDLSIEYANYINDLYLRDNNRNLLKLEKTEEGIYTNGTYYQYVKEVIEDSLNTFINNTEFPTIVENISMDDGNFPGGSTRKKDTTTKKTKKYNSVKVYIAELNKNKEWVKYDENTKIAKITSIKDFVNNYKKVNKDVCAFDSLNRNQVTNKLFGVTKSKSLHYDSLISDLVSENEEQYAKFKKWNKSYITAYNDDLIKEDDLKYTVKTRYKMYNPMFYLTDETKQSESNVAKNWRINSGIGQSNIADVDEINLYLALKSNNVTNIEYTKVWEQEHCMAEIKGEPIKNFIEWISKSI